MKRFIFVLLVLFAKPGLADQFVYLTKGTDLVVTVPIDRAVDKVVQFENKVSLGAPPDFKNYYRTQIVDSVLYITAMNPTSKKFRLFVKDLKTSNTFPILIEANNTPEAKEKLIVSASQKPLAAANSISRFKGKAQSVSPVDLVRVAAQTLYAPSFAFESQKGIRKVGVTLPDNLDFIYEGFELSIKPIVSFVSGGLTVTAFELTNPSVLVGVEIDVNKIASRVDAISAVVQHKRLGTDATNNKTALYVVTEGAFASKLKIRGR